MNVTDHIVSLLKSGKTVELNGIGAFVVKTEDAYMDESTNTFYPPKQTIEFQPYSDDKGNIINFIAKKECVDESTAAKIWKNFSDALFDKVKTQKHTFPGIGDLCMEDGAFAFIPIEGLNLMADNNMSAPLNGVEKFNDTPKSDDPFAVFDNPEAFAENAQDSEPESIQNSESDPESQNNDNTPTSVETIPEPATTEPEPEPEPVASTNKNDIEETATKKEDNITAILDNEPDTKKGKKEEPKKKKRKGRKILLILLIIFLLLALGGAAYYYFFIMKKSNIDNQQAPTTTENTEENNDNKTIDENTTTLTDENIESQPEYVNNTTENEVTTSGTAPQIGSDFDYSKYANPFTFDASLAEISNPNAVSENRNIVLNRISNRLVAFLSGKQYTSALDKMKSKLSEFINERLDEKLNNSKDFHIAKLFNYNDVVSKSVSDELQNRKQKRAQYEVIDEIFSNKLLSQYLQELIDAGEVHKDTPKVEVATQPVYTAPIYSSSKQGYDVIAGTYKDKASAVKMASNLRRKGADAYVIDKGGYYYVSAGSARSQTAIEKVLFQLKTWYTSNLAIKRW